MSGIREKFEAFAKKHHESDWRAHGRKLFAFVPGTEEYDFAFIESDWQVWQASRAALKVELPPTITVEEAAEHFNIDEEGIDMAVDVAHMVNGAIAACAAFIKQAGIEVK